jgi:benzoate membrane transport protein
MSVRKTLLDFSRDVSLSAVVAGFVVVLVGFTSTGAVVFQAAQALGATQAQVNSWMWALGIGMGLSSILPSLYYKKPVLSAWSTPGAALIATTSGIAMPEAVGAFIICALLIIIAGVTGWFERLMNRIPMAIASATLAGVLLRFGMDTFSSIKVAPAMVLSMIALYLIGRRFWPRYTVVGVLLIGVVVALANNTIDTAILRFAWAEPVWVTPQFSVAAMMGLAVPLFIVTMASQNMPGVAVIRAAGYTTPISPVIATTGAFTLLLAPFGAFAINLAAITAAIAMSREAHDNPEKRYTAAVMAGIFYCVIGVFGTVVGSLFAAFPKALIIVLAGLALMNVIGNGLAAALKEDADREAAIITFLITASGLSLFGIGSAFWGLVGGVVALIALRKPT